MRITSLSFAENDLIPKEHTCDGSDIAPELHIAELPEGTINLALIMDDPDASGGGMFTHWILWNIDPKISVIANDVIPGAVSGMSDFGVTGYRGPCPSNGKPHHYHFKLYALDAMLKLPEYATKNELESAMQKHILQQTELVGIYQR